VSPNSAATPSNGSWLSVEASIGTPVVAAARAAAKSPWPSWVQIPITPIGARKIGVGRRVPNSSTERSRSRSARNIRGTSPQWSNAVRLLRWVCSSPAPPETYDRVSGGNASSARRSNSANDIGSQGTTPESPAK
jgi:hypothetical protein